MPTLMESLSANVLIGDGAMGTMLQDNGLPSGVSPELWMLSNPDKVLEVSAAYAKAGANVLETNTFGASRLKLAESGHEDSVNAINAMAVKLARQAAGDDRFVAGVIGPSGQYPAPSGSIAFEELADAFAQQAQALSLAGADMILLQTFSDLGEARAAYLGARKVTNLPVAVSLTYGQSQRTLTGTDPETAAAVFAALGADMLGANCSAGPAEILTIINRYRRCCPLPLLAEPNAGLPVMEGGRSSFPMTPEDFSFFAPLFLESGVRYLGGCCGTTPLHIRESAKAAGSWGGRVLPVDRERQPSLASPARTVYLGAGSYPLVIGERLNPSARADVARALVEGDFNLIAREGLEQVQAGADLLDVNAGLAGTDEAANLRQIVQRLQQSTDCPLVIDTVDLQALEQALIHYHGKALINSVDGEEARLAAVLPLARRYGAAVVGMTLDERGVPETAEGRLRIAERILERALEEGLPKEDLYIDCLVMAAATSRGSTAETIKAMMLVKEKLGLVTVLGVSNISHGMPDRAWLNQAFLFHAVTSGADLVFANPLNPDVGKAVAAGAFLAGRDPLGARYLMQAAKDSAAVSKPEAEDDGCAGDDSCEALRAIRQAILENDQQRIRALLPPLIREKSLAELADLIIVPALGLAGDSYAKGETFLPQLLLAADGASYAFGYLKAAMPASASRTLETVVLGTVAGDVHEIGKNIVKALLSSYGYQVVDLGKSVPAEDFVDAVRECNAQILGLSALMTTTMTEMGTVIRRVREAGLDTKILVGGAVLTREYAESIQADAYVKDAAEAHGVVRRLLDGLDGKSI